MTEKLIARRELVKRYREFVARDPSQASQLAAVLQDLANDAQGVGELEEALAASAEAIAILRRSGDRADVIAPLAGNLLLRARWLFIAGRDQEGAHVLNEAATVHMHLLDMTPTHGLVHFGRTLTETAVRLSRAGDFRVCAAVCDWAMEVAKRASRSQPEAAISLPSLLTLRGWARAMQGDLTAAMADARLATALASQYSRFDLDGSVGRTAQELIDLRPRSGPGGPGSVVSSGGVSRWSAGQDVPSVGASQDESGVRARGRNRRFHRLQRQTVLRPQRH
jgi:hypothetical protein